MSTYPLDSSASITRSVTEPGKSWVRTVTAKGSNHRVVGASITEVEIVSGVMRQNRDGILTDEAAQAIRLLVDVDFDAETRLIVLRLPVDIVRRAKDLLQRRHVLRASEACQLATALEATPKALRPDSSLFRRTPDCSLSPHVNVFRSSIHPGLIDEG